MIRTGGIELKAFVAAVAIVLAGGCTASSTPIDRIGTLSRPPGSSLLAVDGTATDDVWAVGETHDQNVERSFVEHWDGRGWRVVVSPDAGRLISVAAIASDDAWALGERSLLHWNGTIWRQISLPVRHGYFGSLSASGPDDVWIAGTHPGPFIGHNTRGLSTLVAHFDGRRWTVMHLPNPGSRDNYLNGIEAVAPTDVWAAGYSSDVGKNVPEALTLTMHWDGRSWSVVPSPDPSKSLNVIWGMGLDARSGVWALGHFRAADHHLHALLLRWNGKSWDWVRMGGTSTWSATAEDGISERDAWVVGSEPTSSFAIARCSKARCHTLVPPTSYNMSAESVFAITASDAWLVGTTSSDSGAVRPLVEHWNGTAWAEVAVPSGLAGEIDNPFQLKAHDGQRNLDGCADQKQLAPFSSVAFVTKRHSEPSRIQCAPGA